MIIRDTRIIAQTTQKALRYVIYIIPKQKSLVREDLLTGMAYKTHPSSTDVTTGVSTNLSETSNVSLPFEPIPKKKKRVTDKFLDSAKQHCTCRRGPNDWH